MFSRGPIIGSITEGCVPVFLCCLAFLDKCKHTASMTYVTLHPQYKSYLEMRSLLEMTILRRPDPDESPFSPHVAHGNEIFAFQMRSCHLGRACEISLEAKAR